MPNKFAATWCSASSISQFRNCPRSYYLSSVYKDENKQKVSIVSKAMSLGSAVHGVLEPFADLSSAERETTMFSTKFKEAWRNYSGEIGGFESQEEELKYIERGKGILRNVRANIHHLLGETAKLGHDDLPWMWLSEDEEIILCGKLDYILKTGPKSYHVIDFKTGKNKESGDSLQLPIYSVLLDHFLGDSEFKASYWYVAEDSDLTSKGIPPLEESKARILEIALQMKAARAKQEFICPSGGCFYCRDMEKILTGEAKYVGTGKYRTKLYKI